MSKPQQPELARSGRSDVDPAAVKTRHGGPTNTTEAPGPIPEANLPGHHPEHEQDKPDGLPPRPPARTSRRAGGVTTATRPPEVVEGLATVTKTDLGASRSADGRQRHRFEFEPRVGALSFLLGVTPWTTGVDVGDGELRVRFGPWSLRTPLDNVEGAEVTGPYSWLKVAGPPHVSLADRGLTFATTTQRGVCIRFREPVTALLPGSWLRHPAVTVTVEEPERLVEALRVSR